jgi:hypothetical protein
MSEKVLKVLMSHSPESSFLLLNSEEKTLSTESFIHKYITHNIIYYSQRSKAI